MVPEFLVKYDYQDGSISIIDAPTQRLRFWTSERDPLLHLNFVPKKGGTTIWEKTAETQAFHFSKGALV